MPLYEYECPGCGTRQEVLHMTIPPPGNTVTCACGVTLARIWSAPAVQFEGPGWAKDGYSKGKR